jgi:hypothetical protein
MAPSQPWKHYYGFDETVDGGLVVHDDMYARVRRKCGACTQSHVTMKTRSGCLTVRYCSKQCQKEDWVIHQQVCPDVKLLMELMNPSI